MDQKVFRNKESGIEHPIYKRSSSAKTYNPSESDFLQGAIRMVSILKPEEIPVKKFQIDKPYLRENLKNHPLKDWFFKRFNTEEKDKMRE